MENGTPASFTLGFKFEAMRQRASWRSPIGDNSKKEKLIFPHLTDPMKSVTFGRRFVPSWVGHCNRSIILDYILLRIPCGEKHRFEEVLVWEPERTS
jgi:hypothetical protein